MRELLALAAAGLLAVLGFALLALNQERHFASSCPERVPAPDASRAQCALGFLSVASALPVCIVAQGAAFGSLLWAMLLPGAAMAVAFTLAWRPHWLRPVAAAARLPTILSSSSRGKHVPDPSHHLP